MEPKLSPIEINYDFWHSLIYKIVGDIEESGKKYDLIIAPARGGLIPGTRLSHQLKVPLLPIMYSFRDFPEARTHALDYVNEVLVGTTGGINALIVEDIIDSGKTVAALVKDIREMFGQSVQVDLATCVYNEANEAGIIPQYAGFNINKDQEDRWVNFWWEKVL